MTSQLERQDPPPYDPEVWNHDFARYVAVTEGLRMTPTERLRWLEETMEEVWGMVGTAREGTESPDSSDQAGSSRRMASIPSKSESKL